MKLTLKQLLEKKPCADGAEFLKKSKTLARAWNTCPRAYWMIWGLNAAGLLDDDKARAFACDCAEHTLHIFETKYPGDKRPRLAIEASRRTITDKSPAAIAAWAAAWAAAGDAARAAAGDAAWAADWAAENKWQADHLRELINPFAK